MAKRSKKKKKQQRGIPWQPDQTAGDNVRAHLPLLAQSFFQAGREAVRPDVSPVELHQFRLVAKRFRYTLELFRELYGPGLTDRIEQVKKIQGLLGTRQDCAVLSTRLRAAAVTEPHLLEVLNRLEFRGKHLEERFREYWLNTFDAAGNQLRWMRYLTRPPYVPRTVPAKETAPAAPVNPS